MSIAGAHCGFPSGMGPTAHHRAPSRSLLASRSPCRLPQLEIIRRTAVQHGQSAHTLAGHAGLATTLSSRISQVHIPSLFSNRACVVMSAEGAHGSACSLPPGATRRQLDHLFETLRIAWDINTSQGCDLCERYSLEMEADCGRVGYCYYSVSCGTPLTAKRKKVMSVMLCMSKTQYGTHLACQGCSLRVHFLPPNHASDNTVLKYVFALCRKRMPSVWHQKAM